MAVKQLVVISGKGGTGKTTVVASLAALAREPILADCDVDAPDLHLLLHPEVRDTWEFEGLKLARIDGDACTLCGTCYETCRFDSISDDIVIDPIGCEGCGACAAACPEDAIDMVVRVSGEVYLSSTRFGPMAHARLFPGEEASGKLVVEVRKKAEEVVASAGSELLLIDGPPGIGCPAIAAMSGVNAALIVAEPTMSGKQGMERAIQLADHFGVRAVLTVNRADLNTGMADAIEAWCREKGMDVLTRLPYDGAATDAMVAGRTVVEFDDGPLATALRALWREIETVIGVGGGEDGSGEGDGPP